METVPFILRKPFVYSSKTASKIFSKTTVKAESNSNSQLNEDRVEEDSDEDDSHFKNNKYNVQTKDMAL